MFSSENEKNGFSAMGSDELEQVNGGSGSVTVSVSVPSLYEIIKWIGTPTPCPTPKK